MEKMTGMPTAEMLKKCQAMPMDEAMRKQMEAMKPAMQSDQMPKNMPMQQGVDKKK